jgi:hypothetical protein
VTSKEEVRKQGSEEVRRAEEKGQERSGAAEMESRIHDPWYR